jgi:nucleoside-diphosphate-sugar epimerase
MSLRILVTGSSGFIGSAVCSALAAAGHSVRAASRTPVPASGEPGIEQVELPNLERKIDWSPLVDGMDVVVHLAAIAHRGDADFGGYVAVNHVATADLADCCHRHAIKRLVFVSSIGAQIGTAADHVVTETDEPRPSTSYGMAKLAAEEEVRRSGAPFTILRPVIVYGPGAKANIAFLARIAALPMPLPFGAFRNRRSLLAVENLVRAIELCLAGPQSLNETFIVSDLEPITLPEMFVALREGIGRPPWLVPVPPSAIKGLLTALGRPRFWERIGRDLVASSAKLQRIGWSPQIETEAGLRAMMRASVKGI